MNALDFGHESMSMVGRRGRCDSVDDGALSASLLAVRGLGMLALDAAGRILNANAAAAEVLGATTCELPGRPPCELVSVSIDGAVVAAEHMPFAVAVRTRAPHDTGIVEVCRRDGSHRWVRIETIPRFAPSGELHSVLVTLTDVTATHRAAEALRVERSRLARAGDRFRRVLESVPDAVAVYDGQGFGYANAALVRLFGYESTAELVGKEVTKVLRGHTPVERADDDDGSALREESWQRVDGSCVIVEIAAHGIDLDGSEGTLLIARDITQRKRAQVELLQSARLASVGTLAAGVAHEINNPLSYVIANLDLMTEELRRLSSIVPADRLDELLAMAADAGTGAENVRRIVRGMKLFSRVDEERRVLVNVGSVIDVAINMAHNEMRHRARLVKCYGDVPAVEADEGRLGQVFLNLLVNAAQAIPEGHVGSNEIRVVTSTDAKGRVVVEISDTGAGIPPDVLGRIFDPFFTTKPIGVGTGLGLSICHGLVTELGGELRVESALGVGTTLRVILPAAQAKTHPVAGGVASVGDPDTAVQVRPRARGRVLVVDDDASVGAVVRRVLAAENDVTVVNSGMKALHRIGRGETFDLILCDLMMPEMTGMSFHAALHAAEPAQCERVVFITGGAFSDGAAAFLDRVTNRKVDKPFDFASLRELARSFAPASPAIHT